MKKISLVSVYDETQRKIKTVFFVVSFMGKLITIRFHSKEKMIIIHFHKGKIAFSFFITNFVIKSMAKHLFFDSKLLQEMHIIVFHSMEKLLAAILLNYFYVGKRMKKL